MSYVVPLPVAQCYVLCAMYVIEGGGGTIGWGIGNSYRAVSIGSNYVTTFSGFTAICSAIISLAYSR